MLKEDFVIRSHLRRVVARTEIDPAKLDFGTVRGIVYIKGYFQLSRLNADWDKTRVNESTAGILLIFEKKVRALPGVSDVIFQLQNWRKEKGQWVPIEAIRKEETDGSETK